MSPILTDSPFIPLTQLPWHCLICGHIFPHIPGNTVVSDNILYASLYFSSFTAFINSSVLYVFEPW